MLERAGKMPKLTAGKPRTGKDGKVPDLKGLGLMDAIYAIENDGYRCSYSGTGHVSRQSPAPGTKMSAGGVVSITLK